MDENEPRCHHRKVETLGWEIDGFNNELFWGSCLECGGDVEHVNGGDWVEVGH